MKTEREDAVCSSSINEPNVWYIFRENGVEVKIEKIGNCFKASHELTENEQEYLNENLK